MLRRADGASVVHGAASSVVAAGVASYAPGRGYPGECHLEQKVAPPPPVDHRCEFECFDPLLHDGECFVVGESCGCLARRCECIVTRLRRIAVRGRLVEVVEKIGRRGPVSSLQCVAHAPVEVGAPCGRKCVVDGAPNQRVDERVSPASGLDHQPRSKRLVQRVDRFARLDGADEPEVELQADDARDCEHCPGCRREPVEATLEDVARSGRQQVRRRSIDLVALAQVCQKFADEERVSARLGVDSRPDEVIDGVSERCGC
jgi:hypothetical protein